MKTTSLALIVASALCASLSSASDTHDADHALESGLRATLNEKHVHIHVHKGIVTLEGRVPTEADRQRLETMVRNTPGVVAVNPQLFNGSVSPEKFQLNPDPSPEPRNDTPSSPNCNVKSPTSLPSIVICTSGNNCSDGMVLAQTVPVTNNSKSTIMARFAIVLMNHTSFSFVTCFRAIRLPL